MSATQSQLAAPSPDDAVRHHVRCTLCGARPGAWCQQVPIRGLHLARWVDGCAAGVISRGELADVVVALVVVTKWTVVAGERAA